MKMGPLTKKETQEVVDMALLYPIVIPSNFNLCLMHPKCNLIIEHTFKSEHGLFSLIVLEVFSEKPTSFFLNSLIDCLYQVKGLNGVLVKSFLSISMDGGVVPDEKGVLLAFDPKTEAIICSLEAFVVEARELGYLDQNNLFMDHFHRGKFET